MGADETTPNPAITRWLVQQTRLDGLIAALDGIQWTAGDAFATSTPTPEMIEIAKEVLAQKGMSLDGEIILVRHRSGQGGLPLREAGSAFGFTIDLTDSRTSADGGALLFAHVDGHLRGWKAESGAVTTWSGVSPLLTELGATAPERITLFGGAGAGSGSKAAT